MHTPMSVRSMGLTVRDIYGPDRVARLNHYAIGDYALPAPAACSATHRRPPDPYGSAGRERAAGAAGRRPPSRKVPLDLDSTSRQEY